MLPPPPMLDTNIKYEDQIHWIFGEPSEKQRHIQKERKEVVDTSQLHNLPYKHSWTDRSSAGFRPSHYSLLIVQDAIN
jgi:hypothetical protein